MFQRTPGPPLTGAPAETRDLDDAGVAMAVPTRKDFVNMDEWAKNPSPASSRN
jgi:hypothetical protein